MAIDASIKVWTAFGLAILCSACGSDKPINAPVSAGEAQADDTGSLCWYASISWQPTRNIALAELARRGAVRGNYLTSVRARKVVPGMNSCETIAAWGDPDNMDNLPPPERGKQLSMTYDYGNRGTVEFDANGYVSSIDVVPGDKGHIKSSAG